METGGRSEEYWLVVRKNRQIYTLLRFYSNTHHAV